VTDNQETMSLRETIEALQKHAENLSHQIPTDDELPDAIGDVNSIEGSLARTRRKWEPVIHELPAVKSFDQRTKINPRKRTATPTAKGQRWAMVPKTKTERSYNTPAILAAVHDALLKEDENATLFDALRTLLAADAVRLTWRYTDLKDFLSDARIGLRTAFEEIDDGAGIDGPMIGEWKKPAGVEKVAIKDATP
jgi:hypothetical protein